jgi:hypothetical protein
MKVPIILFSIGLILSVIQKLFYIGLVLSLSTLIYMMIKK